MTAGRQERIAGPRATAARERGADRSGVPSFYAHVYRLVRRVPAGKVVTYGQVAAMLGHPRAARAVGLALGALRGARLGLVPWHRVLNAAGGISGRHGGFAEIQRERLEREGVRFDRRGRVDLRRVRWAGPRGRPRDLALRHEP